MEKLHNFSFIDVDGLQHKIDMYMVCCGMLMACQISTPYRKPQWDRKSEPL